MSYYIGSVYVGISCLLCLSYSLIEYVKKRNFDSTTQIIISLWVAITIIVGGLIAYVTVEQSMGNLNYTYLFIALILICISLSTSSILTYNSIVIK